MNQHVFYVANYLLVFGVAMIADGLLCADVSAQGFHVRVGSATVDISSGTGIANATIDIAIENPTAGDLPFAGYSFFLEIEPAGRVLPTGASFDTIAATYSSGDGTGLLSGASSAGTLNLTPAAGDLGLSQIQFFDASVAAGASETLLTVNLVIDLGTAIAGEYRVSLSTDGQNSISSTGDIDQAFTSTAGALTFEAAPDLIGDVNCDGDVNFLDIAPFISLLSSGEFLDKADIDQNGAVDFLDIAPFIAALSA